MFSKLSIKVLAIALAILVVALLIGKLFDNKGNERTFRKDILEFEVSDITSFKTYAAGDKGNALLFDKKAGKWHVSQNGNTYIAEQSEVRNLLFLLRNSSIERVVATKQDKWSEFNLDTDNVLVLEVNTKEDSEMIYLGGSRYLSGGNSDQKESVLANGARFLSFIRINDEKISYAVGGLIRPSFEKPLDEFRDKVLFQGVVGEWDELSIIKPNGDEENYLKVDGKWEKNGGDCDSMAMVSYLRSLSKIKGEHIFHGDISQLENSIGELSISGESMKQPVTISCYGNDTLKVFKSSLRPEDYFLDKEDKINKKLFNKLP